MSHRMTYEAAEDILELPRRYTKEDVRRSYTKLARTYHPDAAARHHYDADEAQRLMVAANQAYELLREQFVEDAHKVVDRAQGGIAHGYRGVDWREGADDADDPWAFADDWAADSAPAKVPLSLRTVVLGPVIPRFCVIMALGWAWWRLFPLLPRRYAAIQAQGELTLFSWALVFAAAVYPTYFFVYEALTGYLSELLREVLNGAVSWVLRRYVDLRPKSASYGCALYKLLKNQVYALLLAPLVLMCAGAALLQGQVLVRIALLGVAAALGVDALAACVHGGLIDVWSSALADRVEARYLLVRASLLKRCDQWGHSGAARDTAGM